MDLQVTVRIALPCRDSAVSVQPRPHLAAGPPGCLQGAPGPPRAVVQTVWPVDPQQSGPDAGILRCKNRSAGSPYRRESVPDSIEDAWTPATRYLQNSITPSSSRASRCALREARRYMAVALPPAVASPEPRHAGTDYCRRVGTYAV